MKKIALILTAAALAPLFYSCDETGETTETTDTTEVTTDETTEETTSGATIDLSDVSADELTEAMDIMGSTVVEGTPPAPSMDVDSPSIDEESLDTEKFSNAGGETFLPVAVSSGDVAGVYLQIEGSGSYFDIPLSALEDPSANESGSFIAARITVDQEDLYVPLPIPEAFGDGEFVVEYCVYDSENRVSNVVTVTIRIVSVGGENASFITDNDWELVKATYKIEGTEDECDIVGEIRVEDSGMTTIECGENQGILDFEYEETFVIKFFMISFRTDGTLEYGLGDAYGLINFFESNCDDGIIYSEEIYMEDGEGIWMYDPNTDKFILAIKGQSMETYDGELVESSFEEFALEGTLVQEDDHIILTFTVEDEETIFEFGPKV